jgi:FkbM family methyltransferase
MFRRYGIRHVVDALRQVVPDGKLVEMRLDDVAHPLYLRAGSSDPVVFEQIFLDDEYDIHYPPDPKLIVDAGANIGMAAVYFANRFPNATIISIEPEPGNYAVLQHNTARYERIRNVHGGIWGQSAEIEVRNIGLREFGFVVVEVEQPTPSSFRGYTVDEILASSGFDRIDILKIDIEGSEKEVFSAAVDGWLGRVGVLILELHDRFKPGCREAVENALRPYRYTTQTRGENIYYFLQ